MSIQNYLNKIKDAVFGKDIREAIYASIKQCYDDAAVNHDNANMEVKFARGSHHTLNDRLTEHEKNQKEINEQLDKNMNVTQTVRSEYASYNPIARCPILLTPQITVIGDSISHGANCSDMVNDSWCGIMRKFIQLEYNTKNHGFVHMRGSISNSNTYYDIHDINTYDAWIYKEFTGTNIGGDSLYSESITGLDINVKKGQKYFKLMYTQAPQCGIIEIYVDEVLRTTVDCSGEGNDYMLTPEILGNENAPFKISILKKGSKPINFSGIYYYNNWNEPMFNNYALSGIALSEIHENVLSYNTDSNLVFFALGVNDRWKSSIDNFKNKINYLISIYSNPNLNSQLVVLDFSWYWTIEEDEIKQELKRLADNTNSIYIDFNKILGNKNIQELKQIGFLKDDDIHPTPNGHGFIAEVVAKKVGLGCSSKKLAEKLFN